MRASEIQRENTTRCSWLVMSPVRLQEEAQVLGCPRWCAANVRTQSDLPGSPSDGRHRSDAELVFFAPTTYRIGSNVSLTLSRTYQTKNCASCLSVKTPRMSRRRDIKKVCEGSLVETSNTNLRNWTMPGCEASS